MQFTVTRYVPFDQGSALKAFCDVVLDGQVLVRGIRVVEGKHGPFVSMPRQRGKNGNWYDSVVALTKDAKQALARAVLAAHRDSGTPSADESPTACDATAS